MDGDVNVVEHVVVVSTEVPADDRHILGVTLLVHKATHG